MSSRVLSNFKAASSSSQQLKRPQLSPSSSPAGGPKASPPREGMIKKKPPQGLSESEIRSKVKEHFNKSKAPQKEEVASSASTGKKNKKVDRETAKKESHEKARKDMGKGVKVKKPEVNANDPSNPNTGEKIKEALNNDMVNFSSKERAALSHILADKES